MEKGVQTIMAVVGGIGGYLLFNLSGWSVETKLAVLIAVAIAMIGYPIGWLVGRYVARDSDVDGRGFKTTAFVGLLSFIVPVAGMAMSAIIWEFYKQSAGHRILYGSLSLLVGLMAAGNAALGAAQASFV